MTIDPTIIFILGLITGLLISLICMVTVVYFRKVIEQKTTIIQKQIEKVGPKPKGFLFTPPSEADEVREKIIAKNKKIGRDTPIEDLMP